MGEIVEFVIEGIKDFDLTHIFECGQCFRWTRRGASVCVYGGAAGDLAAVIRFDGDTLTIKSTGGSEKFWRGYFDLDTDYGEIKRTLIAADPLIAPAAAYGGGIRILNQKLFETIISFVISQNNNIPRIRKNIESLCRRYGNVIENSDALEPEIITEPMYAFPSPESLAEAKTCELENMKLGYRSQYITDAAKKFLEDGAPSSREELLEYRGIGPKVADCIMLFGLRDTGAFPVDTWVKQVMSGVYGFDPDDVVGMMNFAKSRFGRFAGYAQQYLFYYYRDIQRQKQQADNLSNNKNGCADTHAVPEKS